MHRKQWKTVERESRRKQYLVRRVLLGHSAKNSVTVIGRDGALSLDHTICKVNFRDRRICRAFLFL